MFTTNAITINNTISILLLLVNKKTSTNCLGISLSPLQRLDILDEYLIRNALPKQLIDVGSVAMNCLMRY